MINPGPLLIVSCILNLGLVLALLHRDGTIDTLRAQVVLLKAAITSSNDVADRLQ